VKAGGTIVQHRRDGFIKDGLARATRSRALYLVRRRFYLDRGTSAVRSQRSSAWWLGHPPRSGGPRGSLRRTRRSQFQVPAEKEKKKKATVQAWWGARILRPTGSAPALPRGRRKVGFCTMAGAGSWDRFSFPAWGTFTDCRGDGQTAGPARDSPEAPPIGGPSVDQGLTALRPQWEKPRCW